ncbi:MAG TPA: phospholipase D-like domain-containing protein [Polyangiaceae bacterium]
MKRPRWIWIVAIAVLVVIACAGRTKPPTTSEHVKNGSRVHGKTPAPTATVRPNEPSAPSTASSFFVLPSPDGLAPVAAQIASAKKSIEMIMFHLSERSMIDALLAAKARGVDVRLILDAKNLKSKSSQKIVAELEAHGVVVTPSSPDFSITHAKAMVIDDERVVVMSLNLTTIYPKTRDYGVVTTDHDVVAEFDRVFAADVQNAAAKTKITPPLSCTKLLWSPVSSEPKLVGLIDSAQQTIVTSTENLGDSAIEAALARAAARHVSVRVLTPLCDLNPNPLFNVPLVKKLDAEGVDARVMPGPSSPARPYVHAKMMIVDGKSAYVGSVNFSENSTHSARELGIVIDDPAAIGAFGGAFESDWAQAILPPEDTSNVCGKHAANPEGDVAN